jgi:hypothetical protein
MHKIFFILLGTSLVACNAGEDKTKVESMNATTSDSTKKEMVSYPYNIEYSSSFEIGDAKQSKIILDLWKDWDNGTLSNSKDHFADSVELHFADGNMIHSSRDSMMAIAQSVRDKFSKVVSSVSAVLPVKSTDKNENWVTVWGKEIDTHKDGKVDSFYLQETWRFNSNGKVDLLYQYMAKPMPPKK